MLKACSTDWPLNRIRYTETRDLVLYKGHSRGPQVHGPEAGSMSGQWYRQTLACRHPAVWQPIRKLRAL